MRSVRDTLRRTLAAALCTAVVAALSACTVCTEELVDETISPNQQWTTRTTTRDCGRLSTPTTNVYLQRADGHAKLGEIVVLVRHVHALHIIWANDTQIRVECLGCGEDVRIARPNVHGIVIAVTH